MEQNQNPTPAGFEQQLAEAEERGYRRGLNEQIEKRMQEPSLWESPGQKAAEEPQQGFEILNTIHKSIWE
ncbi:MAG: hypothetical protein NC301_02125 [Bacteroides sp.]|nr:hypothetical protein [Bacteroides sp.]MCM1379062.1 hypothetical protein [Bacteroides sp.]MCM1445760.1 hypothetical protein [Prevotella sp.]